MSSKEQTQKSIYSVKSERFYEGTWNHPSSCCSSSDLRKNSSALSALPLHDILQFDHKSSSLDCPQHHPSMSSVKSSGSSWAAWDSCCLALLSHTPSHSLSDYSEHWCVHSSQLPTYLCALGPSLFLIPLPEMFSLTSILICPNPAHSSRFLCSYIPVAAIPKLLFLPQGICLPAAAFPDASWHLRYCANQSAHHLMPGVR